MNNDTTKKNFTTGTTATGSKLGEEAKEKCFQLTTLCRHSDLPAECELSAKKVPTAIQNAIRCDARYCCILGSDELTSGQAKIKNLSTREEQPLALNQLIPTLKELYANPPAQSHT